MALDLHDVPVQHEPELLKIFGLKQKLTMLQPHKAHVHPILRLRQDRDRSHSIPKGRIPPERVMQLDSVSTLKSIPMSQRTAETPSLIGLILNRICQRTQLLPRLLTKHTETRFCKLSTAVIRTCPTALLAKPL